MKWFKKHKDDIVDGVKFFITMYTMIWGFWWTYMWAWSLFGLPLVWWSIFIAMALAFLSLFGFWYWVAKG